MILYEYRHTIVKNVISAINPSDMDLNDFALRFNLCRNRHAYVNRRSSETAPPKETTIITKNK